MYYLRITIDGITPPIWRLIKIPETFSLNKLHHIIQIAFGWENKYIYCFRHDEVPTTNPILWGGGVTIYDKRVKIKDVLQQVGDTLPYEYDIADGWKHTIVLENIKSGLSKWAQCPDGARAAPPEDFGGVRRYQEIIYHLCHPEIDGYLELLDLLGDNYDSEQFDQELANKRLRELGQYIKAYEEKHGLW